MDLLLNADTVNANELETLITTQLELLATKPKLAGLLPPMMVWGAPGLGKSTIIRELCEKRGIGFIDVRLAQREPVDIRGLPVPRGDGVEWLVSAEWPREPDSAGIILFDELTAADRSLQVAAYEFILDRRLGHLYRVPDKWYIMGAGNRLEDHAVSTSMSSALANRFMHIELAADANVWIKWALRNNIHPDIIGFLRYRPDLLFSAEKQTLQRGWPTPRSWARVSIMIDALSAENNEKLLSKSVNGLVGIGPGSEFAAFRKVVQSQEDVRALMLDPTREFTPPTRADQKYAVVSAMVYWLHRGETPAEEAQLLDGFFRLSVKLPSDFAAMAMIDALNVDSANYAEKLYLHPMYAKWQERHGFALRLHSEGAR